MNDWKVTKLSPSASVRDAIKNLDSSGLRIGLIVDKKDRLLGTLSDGDIRRGLLKGLQLNDIIETIMEVNPLVVPKTMSSDLIMQLMSANRVHQIPVVDQKYRVIGLHLWDELTEVVSHPNTVLLMAGGMGKRLMPKTEAFPKPMLEVGGKPMLEIIIERARLEGFKKFLISVHHFGHIIEDFFGSGEKLGVEISYLKETKPLGTAGAVSLLKDSLDNPLLVANGDVLTDFSYTEILNFHKRHNAIATMAVRQHEFQNPYGVVEMDGIEIVGFNEKPVTKMHVNGGVYVVSPKSLNYLKKDEKCDMPTLFERLRNDGLKTIAFPIHERWLDIGRPEDLDFANKRQRDKNRLVSS